MQLFPGRFLEEIDTINIGRVEQALTARRYAEAWERHHAPRGDARHIQAQLEAERRAQDRRMVEELVRLAASNEEKRVNERGGNQ